ncbi:MAG: RES domain-containing protein [Candidatus Dormibacteria bacterium]
MEPPGLPCLYLTVDVSTARANVSRLFIGLPYGPETLDEDTGPLLIDVGIPPGRAVDAHSVGGLAAVGLPVTYPLDTTGSLIPHRVCQAIGQSAYTAGLDGVSARSAAPNGGEELAWFPRDSAAASLGIRQFAEWF